MREQRRFGHGRVKDILGNYYSTKIHRAELVCSSDHADLSKTIRKIILQAFVYIVHLTALFLRLLL